MSTQGSSGDLVGSFEFTKGTWEHLVTWGGRKGGAILGSLSYRRGLRTWFTDASVRSSISKGGLEACMAGQGSSRDLGGSFKSTKGTLEHQVTWGGRKGGDILGSLSYRRGLQTWFTDASVSSANCKRLLAACMATQASSGDLGWSFKSTKGTWQHLVTWGGRIYRSPTW